MSVAQSAAVPTHPHGGDPRRRIRLHHVLVRRRRWSRELDELLGVESTFFTEDIDYHRTHLDRSWTERELIGARMAAAGWVP